MFAAKRMTSAEKQRICRRLVSILKKRYKLSLPKTERPILETIIYGICLENASVRHAEEAFERIAAQFHDLNEVRVSSISELEGVFDGMVQPEWRALRIRDLLQFVFEKQYSFEFEVLRRKTLEQAGKQLARIRHLTPFIRSYTLQTVLGAHVVPLDDQLLSAAIWLGLIEPGTTVEQGTDALKSAVRKADSQQFCLCLRSLATDPKVNDAFDFQAKTPPENGFDLASGPDRLKELFQDAGRRARKRKAAKKARKKSPKKAAKRAGAKSAARKQSATRKKATRNASKKTATRSRKTTKKR